MKVLALLKNLLRRCLIMDKISYQEFKRVDLCVGTVQSVELHPHAEKLYLLKVDLGDEIIQLVAGLRQYYKEESLVGKQIVVVRNLQPTHIRGIESQGMLLAAVSKDRVCYITPEKN